MNQCRAFTKLLIIAALSISSIHCSSRKHEEHNDAYQSALQSYAHVLKPGMTRGKIEAYLRSKETAFQQMCCMEGGESADLIEVGQEKTPWYCSEHNVYIAFLFAVTEPRTRYAAAADSDVLTKIAIHHQLGGCL